MFYGSLTSNGSFDDTRGVWPGALLRFAILLANQSQSVELSAANTRISLGGQPCALFGRSAVPRDAFVPRLSAFDVVVRAPAQLDGLALHMVELNVVGRMPTVHVFPVERLFRATKAIVPFAPANNDSFVADSGEPVTFIGTDSGSVGAFVNRARKRTDAEQPLPRVGTIAAQQRYDSSRAYGDRVSNILVAMVYASDCGVGSECLTNMTGVPPAQHSLEAQRNYLQLLYDTVVTRYFEQVSHSKVAYKFIVTPALPLPGSTRHYVGTDAEIKELQAELNATSDVSRRAELEAALKNAIPRVGMLDRKGDYFFDVVELLTQYGFSTFDADGVVVAPFMSELRSAAYSNFHGGVLYENRESRRAFLLDKRLQMVTTLIPTGWNVAVHELAHNFLGGDIYADDPSVIFADNGKLFDILGWGGFGAPLPSGFTRDNAHWIAEGNIKRFKFAAHFPVNETVRLVAHDVRGPNAVGNGLFVLVQIELFAGFSVYVEVRQGAPSSMDPYIDRLQAATAGRSADVAVNDNAWVSYNADKFAQLYDLSVYPLENHTEARSGVLLTKAALADGNQAVRPLTMFAGTTGLLRQGQSAEDTQHRLRIEVLECVSCRTRESLDDWPAVWDVRILWGVGEAHEDVGATENLRIRRAPLPWSSDDIWIDSPANEFDKYSGAVEPATGNAFGQGDAPVVGVTNRLHATVWNDGNATSPVVLVTGYVHSPPGVGDNGQGWLPLWTSAVQIGALNFSRVAPPNGWSWTPVKGEHTCLRVSIGRLDGERTFADNEAQENIADFDLAGGSPHDPLLYEAMVENASDDVMVVDLTVFGVPYGYEATVSARWVRLEPRGRRRVLVALVTDIGRSLPYDAAMTSSVVVPLHRFARVATPGSIASASVGVCCARQATSTGSTEALRVSWTWSCNSTVSYESCAMSGGRFLRGATCADEPCRDPADSAAAVPCCVPKVGCVQQPSMAACLLSKGVPLGAVGAAPCRSSTDERCYGACCASSNDGDITSSTCSDTDRGTCETTLKGQLSVGRRCTDSTFVCAPRDVRLSLVGSMIAWDLQPSVLYSPQDAPLHMSSIGGVQIDAHVRKRVHCAPLLPTGGSVGMRFCVVDDLLRPRSDVRLLVIAGVCDAMSVRTGDDGCATVPDVQRECYSRVTNLLLVRGIVVAQEDVARGDCSSALFRCTASTGAGGATVGSGTTCGSRIDHGRELCRFDEGLQQCSRTHDAVTGAVCQLDSDALECRTVSDVVVPCAFDPVLGACSRTDCPTNPLHACYESSRGVCSCGVPLSPCELHRESGRCTRSDCPSRPETHKCAPQVRNGVLSCGCMPREPCQWSDALQRCVGGRDSGEVCAGSTDRSPCLPLRRRDGSVVCNATCSVAESGGRRRSIAQRVAALPLERFVPVRRMSSIAVGVESSLPLGLFENAGGALALMIDWRSVPPVPHHGTNVLEALLRYRDKLLTLSESLRAATQPPPSSSELLAMMNRLWFLSVGGDAGDVSSLPHACSLPEQSPASLWWQRNDKRDVVTAFDEWWAREGAASGQQQLRLDVQLRIVSQRTNVCRNALAVRTLPEPLSIAYRSGAVGVGEACCVVDVPGASVVTICVDGRNATQATTIRAPRDDDEQPLIVCGCMQCEVSLLLRSALPIVPLFLAQGVPPMPASVLRAIRDDPATLSGEDRAVTEQVLLAQSAHATEQLIDATTALAVLLFLVAIALCITVVVLIVHNRRYKRKVAALAAVAVPSVERRRSRRSKRADAIIVQ
jgi:hypothetical protein